MPTYNISQHWAFLAVGLAAMWALKAMITHRRRNPRRLPYPPGPKGWPILGNVTQIPKTRPWEGYHALCQEYGDLVYLKSMGQCILVIGSRRRAEELLEDRSTNYSDRPTAMIQDLADMNWSFGLMPYGSWWRKHRRTFHEFFRPKDLAQWHPVMYEERDRLLNALKEEPEEFYEHMKLMFGTIVMRVSYGYDDPSENKTMIRNASTLLAEIGEARKPGRFLVNVLPVLRHVPQWIPGAEFQKHFKRLAIKSRLVRDGPFERVQASLDNKESSRPSIAATLIDRLPEEGNPERTEAEIIARNASASAFFAGSDTTLAVAHALLLAIASNPDVQRKAQQELDTTVGRHRLPLINDRPALPYCQAIVKEAGRWYSAIPIATARSSTEDDEYDGYFIPKGTYILPLSWPMMHDPELFEKPFEFTPERYLKDGQIDTSIPDATYAAFGFGRRICPGMHFSNDALFMFLTGFLSTFNINAPLDDEGRPIKLELEQMDVPVIARAAPFQCSIVQRNTSE